MKRSKLKLIAGLAIGVALGRSAQADTVLTFDTLPRRPDRQVSNAPIVPSFGDFAGTSSDGVEVIGFGSPAIALDFGGGPDAAARWDYYVDSVWTAGQLNGSAIGNFHTVVFTPGPSAGVMIKSFNFHPYYVSDETFTYDWSVRAGATVLASGSMSFGSDGTKNYPVTVNYSGSLGQALTLRLDRTGGTGSGQNIAVDDIHFAQFPEPAGPYLLSVAPGPGQNPTPPDARFEGIITNGITQLVSSSIRLSLNGTLVTPTVTPLTQSARVTYQPPAPLPSLSSNLYRLTFSDNGTPARSFTNDVSFVVGPYVNIQLPTAIYREDFNGVSEGSLPGWTVENFTSPLAPGSDPNNIASDFYMDWAVVSPGTVTNIASVAAGYMGLFNVAPYQVVNNQVLSSLVNGNLLLAASDGRLGMQVQYIYTSDYNLSGRANVYLSFHNLWAQNQDSFGAVEYSTDQGATWQPALYLLDGPDILRDGSGRVDASNTLATVYGDIPDPVAGTPGGGHFGGFIGVARENWAALGPHMSGRVNDDLVESKRVEVIRLAGADNKPAVRFRFANVGTDSWHFGIDNFGIYSGAVMPPLLLGVTPASRSTYVGATVSFEANARGAIPLSFQWRKNGVNIPGQTSQTLSLANLRTSDAGNYTVVVTSSGVSVTSSPPATLTVNTPPTCGVTEGLMVYLKMDNNINGQGGTTVNGSVYGIAERYVPGILGQAASFRNDAGAGGPSDWTVTLGNQDAIYDGSFTVGFWVKTSIASDGAFTGNKDWNSGGNIGWLFNQFYNTFVNFRANGGSRYDVGAEMRDGLWHHVALAAHRATNGFRVYLDGNLAGLGTIGPTGAESLGAGHATLIGGSGPGYYSGSGDIDDYAIWNRALSADELACIYANGLGGKSLDLLPSDPRLYITVDEFADATISWGSNFNGYTLECSPSLGPDADWDEVPGVVNNSVIVFAGAEAKFFRLRRGP
jgi:hypothetical protein